MRIPIELHNMGKLDIPKVGEIIEEAIETILKKYSIKTLKELFETISFSEVVNKVEEEAENLYRNYEREAIKKYLQNRGLANKDVFEAIEKILDNSLITSIANIRRSRAGLTSQQILAKALKELGIPCQISKISFKGYRPDITVPSDIVIKKDLSKGFAIAVKRTLRERWAEDIDVFKFPNSAFVLIKPDSDFTPAKAMDMVKRGMKSVYIPDDLYEKYKEILEKEFKNIFKKLSDLPKDLIEFLQSKESS